MQVKKRRGWGRKGRREKKTIEGFRSARRVTEDESVIAMFYS